MHTTPSHHATETLCERSGNGITVSLRWRRQTNAVSVHVVDEADGHAFVIDVRGESPLEVFHHPYAYAAFRGLDAGPLQSPREPIYA